MALLIFLPLLGLACVYAIRDWRRGWMLLPLFAALQDPVRKLTPGQPVVISFSIMAIYAAVLVSARGTLLAYLRELTRRFPTIATAGITVGFCLVLAALNGLLTFGLSAWQVPALSLALYLAPLPAVILGYAFLQREELLYRFFRVYAAVTSVAMIGTLLEYWHVRLPVLGTVSMQFDYVRHLPGLQIRMLSGIYRAPDIMSWHAATLTSIGLVMAMKSGSHRALWIGVTGWGFLNCMLSGRRKAVYFVLAFTAAVVWRYFRRLRARQVLAFAAAIVVVGGIVQHLASSEATSVYTRGATATNVEILRRMEGGVMETFRQFGLMGAGLGAATQGTRHLAGQTGSFGWQEGGLGKLAVELGLPGLLASAMFALLLFRMLLRLTSIGDVPGSSQFIRAALFGFLVANVITFTASAQAYTDGVLALLTAFLAGCLLATAALDERLADAQQPAATTAGAPVPA